MIPQHNSLNYHGLHPAKIVGVKNEQTQKKKTVLFTILTLAMATLTGVQLDIHYTTAEQTCDYGEKKNSKLQIC